MLMLQLISSRSTVAFIAFLKRCIRIHNTKTFPLCRLSKYLLMCIVIKYVQVVMGLSL